MDETLKSDMLDAVADMHGVDVGNPAVGEEWQSWSVDNQHMAGSALGDAVSSFVDHLTKRGIISITTASTEAQAPPSGTDDTTERYGEGGGGYEEDETPDEEIEIPDEEIEIPDEEIENLAAAKLRSHASYDEQVRRSSKELMGGDGEDDPDYQDHEYAEIVGDHVKRVIGEGEGREGGPYRNRFIGGEVTDEHCCSGEKRVEDYEYELAMVGASYADDDDDDYDYDDADADADADAEYYEDHGEDEESEYYYYNANEAEAGAEAAVEMVGAPTWFRKRPRLTRRSRVLKHAKESANTTLLVNFAARHPVADPVQDVLVAQKMKNQGTYLGKDAAEWVSSYIRARELRGKRQTPQQIETARQKQHMRNVGGYLIINLMAGAGASTAEARKEADTLFPRLADELVDSFASAFRGKAELTKAQAYSMLYAGAHPVLEGVSDLGSATWGGIKKGYTGTRRAVRKTQSMGRALLNSRERQSFLDLVKSVVRDGKITVSDLSIGGTAYGSGRDVRARISSLSIDINKRLADRQAGSAVAMLYMLSEALVRYVTDDSMQLHARQLIGAMLREIDRMRVEWHYSFAPVSTEVSSTPSGVTASVPDSSPAKGEFSTPSVVVRAWKPVSSPAKGKFSTPSVVVRAWKPVSSPAKGKFYTHGDSGYHGSRGRAPQSDVDKFALLLSKASASYLRDNPAAVRKAGDEFALLVPSDSRHLVAMRKKLVGGSAEEQKRYLQNALLARHPNTELDAQGHMLSLSGRLFRIDRAGVLSGAAMRVQQMRRAGRGSKHEDVWDSELRNVGGGLQAHDNHKAMLCKTPDHPDDAVYRFQASEHAGSRVVEIRPLHYRVAPQ